MLFGKKPEREVSNGLLSELEEQRNLRFQKESEIEKYKLRIRSLENQNEVLIQRLKTLSIFSTLSPIVSPILNSKNSEQELIEVLNRVLTKNLQSLLPSLHSLP
jgi:CRISPR/Cas system endoribonuclease Cas6 (RAMP superfamily)